MALWQKTDEEPIQLQMLCTDIVHTQSRYIKRTDEYIRLIADGHRERFTRVTLPFYGSIRFVLLSISFSHGCGNI